MVYRSLGFWENILPNQCKRLFEAVHENAGSGKGTGAKKKKNLQFHTSKVSFNFTARKQSKCQLGFSWWNIHALHCSLLHKAKYNANLIILLVSKISRQYFSYCSGCIKSKTPLLIVCFLRNLSQYCIMNSDSHLCYVLSWCYKGKSSLCCITTSNQEAAQRRQQSSTTWGSWGLSTLPKEAASLGI